MTKAQYAQRHNITIRPVTAQDRADARTDYQRAADYVLTCNGLEYYSAKATLADLVQIYTHAKDYNSEVKRI